MATTESSQLESLKLDDISSCQDISIAVPEDFASFPLGFAVDEGGSSTKIVYRSKSDYVNGKPKNGEHVLRLRFLPKGDGEHVINFLKDNCDVRVTSTEAKSGELPVYYQTGVGVQHYIKRLEELCKCRIKLAPEMELANDSILKVTKLVPELQQMVPFSVESVAAGLEHARTFIASMQKYQEAGINSFGDTKVDASNLADLQAYVMKVMTIDAAKLTEEINSKSLTFPCLIVQCGSATGSIVLHENGKYEMGDFNPAAGKTLLALGRLLTGAQNFQQLLELASKGDSQKVDLLTCDLKNKDHQDTDWYSLMPDQFPVFLLGKAAEARYDGTYSKADLAAALLRMQCQELARFSASVARRLKVTNIVFTGSFGEWPLTQRLLHEQILMGTMLLPFIGEPAMNAHILKHCGFLTALGVWHKNFKQWKETP